MHVRRGDADAWRLETSSGSYFVKGYLQGGEPLARVMEFEDQARAAGIATPEPVRPIDPHVGWLTRLGDRLFRVYRWISGPQPPEHEVSAWLGRTMLQVHRLQPLPQPGLPQWWRGAIRPPATWESWYADAKDRDLPWASLLRDTTPEILAATERLAALCEVAPDIVTTHGDFKPHNLVWSAAGPVLVDWDSVRTDSAALEAARVAYLFGAGQPERVSRILTAYVEAGGNLEWPGPDLFASVTRNHLQVLTDLIRASLGETTAARWMGDPATINTAVGNHLRDLPESAVPTL
ncbi:phosphotransferase enzyme family protein [Kribbella sp. NPDC051587]|uniref:phosphotransferase enzyme family protein n=1 Tax=Kribbella sp. NPDC051587 TaxID=3364119 RepID=UPI00378B6553